MALTSSLASARIGAQQPRVSSIPAYSASAGAEAVELAAMAGLHLDDWQQHVLEGSLGERENGRWAAFEVGVVVPRQNGKGSILEARELAGLFLLGERLIIHSAHQFDTSLEAFRRLLYLIENTPDFARRVKRVSRAHGEEGIELVTGQRIRFRTRTKGGGRGFTSDCLILDEAMILPEAAHGALLPTLSARPNPQVWYTASAVDQYVHEDGIVLARVRERGLAGDDPALAYFEWSVPATAPSDVTDELAVDEEMWAVANPGFRLRISAEHIGREQRSMDPRTFAVERLNVGDWPNPDGDAAVIELHRWRALSDPASQIVDRPVFAFDVTPDRSWAAISVAGTRSDGLGHLEVIEHARGTGWVVDRLADLNAAHRPLGVVCDGASAAASLVPALEDRGVKVLVASAKDHAQAAGMFFDGVDQETFRHLDSAPLTAAVRGAAKRKLGDAWAWSRKSSASDIAPLVAATLALWGLMTRLGAKAKGPPGVINLNDIDLDDEGDDDQ